MKEDLIYGKMYDMKCELDGRIRGVSNLMRSMRISNDERYR
jgi:hypothetical protein